MKNDAVALPLRHGTVVFHKDPAGDRAVREKLDRSRVDGAEVGRKIRTVITERRSDAPR